MKETIDGLMARLDIAEKEAQIQRIEEQASATDFWDDPESYPEYEGPSALIQNNDINDNGSDGIYLQGATGNTIVIVGESGDYTARCG